MLRNSFTEDLISPCGMNCGICSGYLALSYNVKDKGIKMPYCPGCRPRNKQCAFIKKRCELLLNNKIKYCYECQEFPCKNLKHVDKRYKTNFKMSMIENLGFIKKHGIKDFLVKEDKKWKCPNCGEIICCHNGICFSCEFDKLKNKKKLYKWSD